MVIPQRVSTVSNNYATYKPYDPVKALGDIDPSLPIPAQAAGKKGCGIIGTLIVVVIAVVATIYTAGVAANGFGAFFSTLQAGAASLAGGSVAAAAGVSSAGFFTAAGAAAVGSVVSQGVGLAIGAQDKFSWKGVALSALGGGISAGLPALSVGPTWVNAALKGVVSSIATQGVAVATGLQQQFKWSNVAAAGVGGAVGSAVGSALEGSKDFASVFTNQAVRDVATRTISGFAAGVSSAILRGGRIQVTQIATDAFGNALGESLASVSSGESRTSIKPLTADDVGTWTGRTAQEALDSLGPIQFAERPSDDIDNWSRQAQGFGEDPNAPDASFSLRNVQSVEANEELRGAGHKTIEFPPAGLSREKEALWLQRQFFANDLGLDISKYPEADYTEFTKPKGSLYGKLNEKDLNELKSYIAQTISNAETPKGIYDWNGTLLPNLQNVSVKDNVLTASAAVQCFGSLADCGTAIKQMNLLNGSDKGYGLNIDFHLVKEDEPVAFKLRIEEVICLRKESKMSV